MPQPYKRSRTYRRMQAKLPGNRVVMHYVKRKPAKAKCGSCGDLLKGVPRERNFIMRNLPKSHKRPERPYGGNLCSRCTRELIIAKARML